MTDRPMLRLKADTPERCWYDSVVDGKVYLDGHEVEVQEDQTGAEPGWLHVRFPDLDIQDYPVRAHEIVAAPHECE